MEAKTIGSFICALRRASGMTQREFAERLNVSDKTVSRWERDEGAPDLTLIPVIAEIFGVTCDELLRGERRSPEERRPTAGNPEPAESASAESEIPAAPTYTAKAEKQRGYIIRTTLARHRNLSLTAAAVAGIGFLGAMIFNTAFTRAYLGFFLSAILYLAAVICEVMVLNGTLAAVTEDLADETELAVFRYRVYADARAVFVLTAVLLAACIPLLMVGDAYWGLTAEMWLFWGAIFAVIALVLCGIVLYFVENHLLNENIIAYPEKSAALITHRRRLKKNLTLLCVGLLALTAFLNGVLTAFGSTHALAASIRFDDAESFVAFAEQDVKDTYEAPNVSIEYHYDGEITVVPEEDPADQTIYFDQHGNSITEEEAMTRTMEDSSGNVVISYVQRNETISSVSFGAESEGFLPIHVKTKDHIRAAQRQVELTNAVFTVVYLLEVLSVLVAYFLLRTPKKSSRTA